MKAARPRSAAPTGRENRPLEIEVIGTTPLAFPLCRLTFSSLAKALYNLELHSQLVQFYIHVLQGIQQAAQVIASQRVAGAFFRRVALLARSKEGSSGGQSDAGFPHFA